MKIAKIAKISYENWLSSTQKWVKIFKKILEKELFFNAESYSNLKVVTRCGYCEEIASCHHCFLFKKRQQRGETNKSEIPICYKNNTRTNHFCLFVEEMRKLVPNFKIAKYHCDVILNTILEDCPNKEQAVKNGIVFPL